ncbi:hypothetical protein J2S05_000957 [Alkalicoccobacillus murimartini]|uniref:Uncharacterized protein n=1 Tax=Alkalicoccobacillus murimartini TaxID=171685 RepID=A0ABT9YEA3_9BACI|nr:hypothetical protein [Alkalicoccobacillus murimartini]
MHISRIPIFTRDIVNTYHILLKGVGFNGVCDIK